jgi:Fuc2NAc and GlcNAc transferase
MTFFICLLASSFVIALGLTKLVISKADRFGLIDVPNARSAHTAPLPRGGGMSFVVTFLGGLLVLTIAKAIPLHLALPLLTAGPLVAIIGLWDDRKGVSASARLAVHLVAAVVTLYWLTEGFQNNMNISFLGTMPMWMQLGYSILFIMWMINLYNFMDGVDGMAGTQAIVVSLCSAALCLWQQNTELAMLYGLLSCGVAGFLYFNWAPARIFMGDGGAYFLGFLFASLSLINKMFYGESLIALLILMGTFIADATYTLFRRLLRGEKVYLAHNKHAFQRAVQRGWSHRRVVTIYNLITVLWLAPWAVLAVLYPTLSTAFLFIAYSPLLAGVLWLRAGIGNPIEPTPESAGKHETVKTEVLSSRSSPVVGPEL